MSKADDSKKREPAQLPGERPAPMNIPKRKGQSLQLVNSAPGNILRLNLPIPKHKHTSKPRPMRKNSARVRPAGPRPAAKKIRMAGTQPIPIPAQASIPRNVAKPKAGPKKRAAARKAGAKGRPVRKQPAKWLSNRYKLRAILGQGGTGTVYRAEDVFLEMPVAIKILNSKFTFDKAAIATLKEEARIAMRLSHQHIVHLHNLEKSGVNYFLVMEYIKGSTLRELLEVYGYLKLDSAIQILSVCSDALSYAHHHNVLHNDLKPENLLLTEDGVLKIIDFGISCLIDTRQDEYIMGTPSYMSPEQICGDSLDPRADVYSLGIIAYELLTGKTPFPDDAGFHDIIEMLPVSLPGLHEDLQPIIAKAIAPIREDRYETVEAFVTPFLNKAKEIISDQPPPAAGPIVA